MAQRLICTFAVAMLIGAGCNGSISQDEASVPGPELASLRDNEAGTTSDGAIKPGQKAPAVDMKMRSGETVPLSSLEGQVVVLNFWATWCPPCLEELPSLERLRRQLKGASVRVIGVSVDESWEAVDKVLEKAPVNFTIALDPENSIPPRFGTFKFPETFVIDSKGAVVRQYIGAQIWDRGDIVSFLRELAEGEASSE